MHFFNKTVTVCFWRLVYSQNMDNFASILEQLPVYHLIVISFNCGGSKVLLVIYI